MAKQILILLIFAFIVASCSKDETTDLLNETEHYIFESVDDTDAEELESPLNAYKAKKFNITESKCFKYRILHPNDLTPGEKYPLIIYLHGLDHRGDDNYVQLHNLSWFFLQHHNDFPAYVLYPQCPHDAYWSLEERPSDFNPEKMDIAPRTSYMDIGLLKLIEELCNKNQVDPRKVYIMGHSMGGIGVLDIITRHPNIFAGAVAFCGTINPLRFDSSTNVPLYLVHNADDATITVEGSRQAFKRLKELKHTVAYLEMPTGGHVCWVLPSKTNNLLKWLFRFTAN